MPLDGFVFFIQFYMLCFIQGMALMEQADDPFAELKEKFVPTFIRSCLFWLPAQTINFNFIGPRFRVIYVGTCSLIWANILCWVKRQKSNNEIQVE